MSLPLHRCKNVDWEPPGTGGDVRNQCEEAGLQSDGKVLWCNRRHVTCDRTHMMVKGDGGGQCAAGQTHNNGGRHSPWDLVFLFFFGYCENPHFFPGLSLNYIQVLLCIKLIYRTHYSSPELNQSDLLQRWSYLGTVMVGSVKGGQ